MLSAGDSHGSDSKSGYDYSNHDSGPSTLCSQESTRPGRSDSRNELPCPSGSEIEFDSVHADTECSRSDSYPFISDVNSFAWGICGDNYDQHNDSSFRELLFVSGRYGVTVHAFSKLGKSKGMVQTASEGHIVQGRWVEWGPSCTLTQNVEVDESCSHDVDCSGGNGEMPPSHRKVVGDDELTRGITARKWLKSFWTKVKTTVSDGSAWTKFPDKTEFPSSADVISFNLFDGDPPLDFPCKEKHVQNMENSLEDASDYTRLSSLGADTTSNVLSGLFGVEISGFHKCLRVFASASFHLIGFFLTLLNCAPVNTGDANKSGKSRNLLLVAKLESSAIQWVSLVKPDEINTGLAFEWTDFQFSDNLLVCLNSSGLIVLYAAMSGEFVTHLNVAQACGLGVHSDLKGLKKFPLTNDIEIKQASDVKASTSDQHSDPFRRSFKRLVVASHTSLLAVVDENGVIYVICIGDYVPEKNSSYEKLLPYFQQFGLGMLVNWGVGGSDIGRQRVYSDCSSYYHANNLNMQNGSIFVSDKAGSNVLQNIDDSTIQGKGNLYGSHSSVFSATSKVSHDEKLGASGMELHVMRKIFLPNLRFSEDASVSFSPLGITCLSKKQNVKNENVSQLVHFNLLAKLAIYDDSCLNSGYDLYHFNGKEEIFIGEALGCTFQGCFYIVRQDGLSVYLPSISLSPNFLPVEYIGYRQSIEDTWSSYLVKGNVEMKEPIVRCSPWKTEILDKVLLYESTEEADRLCLENGECYQDVISLSNLFCVCVCIYILRLFLLTFL